MNTFTVSLPMPPSGNNLFFNHKHGGRRRTNEYLFWISECDDIVCELPFKTDGLFAGRVVRIDLNYGCPIRARDNDNLGKPVHDFLVSAGIIDDDNCFVAPITHQEYCPELTPNRLFVTVTEITDAAKYQKPTPKTRRKKP